MNNMNEEDTLNKAYKMLEELSYDELKTLLEILREKLKSNLL